MENRDRHHKEDSKTPARPKRDEERQAIEKRLEDYQRQLRRLASELSLTEARERREIASDLHDHIGQALAFVSQKVTTMQGNSIFSGMDEDFSQILKILNQAIRYTRDLTVEISPPVLYELGLPAAIEWQADRALKLHGVKVSVTESGKPAPVAEEVKVFLFKAIQELISNVVKHAGAKSACIHAVWRKNDFEITVSDDGKGFDMVRYENSVSEGCCFGLFSIRERLSYIGGSLKVESTPGRGTRVSLVAPYSVGEETDRAKDFAG